MLNFNGKILLFLFAAIVLCFHCSDRKRSNPLDPQNPDTKGKPTGLRIYSEFDTITLLWYSIDVTGLIGYNIYRKTGSDSSYQLIHETPAESTRFVDRNVVYDLKYFYKISALTSGYESLPSDSVSITPGPTTIWVTDTDNRYIHKISHDGLHEIDRLSVDGYPWDIIVDSRDQSFWYSDLLWGYIYRFKDQVWKIYDSPSTWWEPVDIVFDFERNLLWGADDRGIIIRISPDAADSLLEINHESFLSPVSVSVSQQSGKCWVADPGSNKVFYISGSGNFVHQVSFEFIHPMAVAVDNNDGSCWIADSSRIVKLDFDGNFMQSITANFQYAYLLDVNQQTGEIWVIDYGITHPTSRVLKFEKTGSQIAEVDGFNYPRALAVNPYDNGCYVADTENGRLVRLSAQGEILSELADFYYLRGITIEYKQASTLSCKINN